MISLETYGGKSRVLLGLLLLASSVPAVMSEDYSSLNATFQLEFGDRLVSSPNSYFEFGIFAYNYSGNTGYYLCIRYAFPIDPAPVTWMANRNTPLSSAAVLLFNSNGTLELFDHNQNDHQDVWNSRTDNMDVASATLLDTGKLVLQNRNGTPVWNSFDDSPPTDTLLPGQVMRRSQGHRLTSWQRTGNPAIANANDTYSFGWDDKGVLSLSWTCPKVFLNWKGGSYIPAPDVYAAHTIRDVDSVYFHDPLGHLYIGSNPPTAILSGGPDQVNVTTLKRITMGTDGGLRILQYEVNQTVTSNQTSNQGWKAVANWVVSDRPDSRSQCTTFGTCGPFSLCVSPIDSLGPVTCRCPGPEFTPIDVNDPAQGCQPPTQRADCPNENGTYTGYVNPVGMLELPGVDMPWGGDYRNLTGNASAGCREACLNDCACAGAVLSKDEQMCWLGNGALYNIGYPSEALHGTSRISYLRNQTVLELPQPQAAKKDDKRTVLALAIAIPGGLAFVVVMICIWYACKSPRPSRVPTYPGDSQTGSQSPARNGGGDGL